MTHPSIPPTGQTQILIKSNTSHAHIGFHEANSGPYTYMFITWFVTTNYVLTGADIACLCQDLNAHSSLTVDREIFTVKCFASCFGGKN